MTRRVGLLGGTFDPPHLGHLVVAESARVAFELDEVRLVVAGAPWMKAGTGTTVATHRVEMARLAVADHPAIGVDDRETHRAGPTYTAETLEELHREEPGTSWFFLLGADAAARLGEWHRAEQVLELATFVVVTRPGHSSGGGGAAGEGGPLPGGLVPLEVPPIGISSSQLRHRFAAGGAVRYLVPAPVEAYIHRQGLYRSVV